MGYYRKGQGRRTDLTSVKSNRSSSRDIVSKEMGISSSQLQRLIFIHKHHPEHIELLDKGILTVNQSYLQIQRELKRKKVEKLNHLINQKQLRTHHGDFIRNHLMI